MLFHTPEFFLFFAVYLGFQALLPTRYRFSLILVGGSAFYAWWNPWMLWVPYLLGLLGWGGVLILDRISEPRPRRWMFAALIGAMLAPLAIFKYAGPVYRTLVEPFATFGDLRWTLPLPLGLSFITFTMLAYVVDYHRGVYPLERRPQMVMSAMIFFPHLIAGPILRPAEIMPQLDRPRRLRDADRLRAAFLFALGLAKKTILADQLAPLVEHAYRGGPTLAALDYLTAIWAFSFQIYGDFSGYTDMALGLALLLGVRLPPNFRSPYAAASIIGFWRCWHISLSHWLRDYVYIPLGGNRGGRVLQARNILITMALGGLWHGASWTFVLWGVLHGVGIVLDHAARAAGLFRRLSGRWWHALSVFATFNLVSWLWILFRAPDWGTAVRVAAGPWQAPAGDMAGFVSRHGFELLLLALAMALHRFDNPVRVRWVCRGLRRRRQQSFVWAILVVVVLLAAALNSVSSSKFIYFDF